MRTLALVGLTIASISNGLGAQTPGLRVQVINHKLSLLVSEATPLSAVLDEICRQAGANCEGTQLAATMSVGRMTLSGEWDAVLAELLQGASLNYVSSPPNATQHGTLILQAASSAPSNGSSQSSAAAYQAPAPSAEPVTNPEPINVAMESPENPSSAATDAMPSLPARSAGFSNASAMGMSEGGGWGGGSRGSLAEGMQFPDATGRSAPKSSGEADVLAFPDSTGRAMPQVAPPPPGSTNLLFPDSTGRQAPQTNSSNPVGLQFPDSTGRQPPR